MEQRTEESIREILPLYALGLLDRSDAEAVAAHLESGCGACAHELKSLREAVAELPHAEDTVMPPPRLRDRLMAAIQAQAPAPPSKSGLEQPLPGIFVLKKNAGAWKQTPYQGVSYRLLYFDKETLYATTLLKLEPGAQYPPHRHAGCEQCLVLEGDARLGTVEVNQGDFEFALAGSEHGVVTTTSGCVLLIVAHQHDEIFA